MELELLRNHSLTAGNYNLIQKKIIINGTRGLR